MHRSANCVNWFKNCVNRSQNCVTASAQQILRSFLRKFGCMSDAPNETNAQPQRISLDEEMITLTQAACLLPKIDGRKVAVSTLWRWCHGGLRGLTLPYVRVGRKVCTTHRALLEFFTKLAELDEQTRPSSLRAHRFNRKPITSRQRQRALAEADAVLERAGI